jgi:hypothetical protein
VVVALAGCGDPSIRAARSADQVHARTSTTRSSRTPSDGAEVAPAGLRLASSDESADWYGRDLVRLEHAGRGLFLAGSPLAVVTPDARSVVYNAWTVPTEVAGVVDPATGLALGTPIGHPSLLVHDLDTGRNRLLADAAQSVAVSATGRVAYAQGTGDVRRDVDYLTDVVVRDELDADAVRWTDEPGRYLVNGWAGDRLVVTRSTEGQELGTGEILVLDGPGTARIATERGSFLGISADGGVLAIATDREDLPLARVRTVALDDLRVADVSNAPDLVGVSGGSWVGERLVVSASLGGRPVLATFSGTDHLEFELSYLLDPGRVSSAVDPYVADDGRVGAIGYPATGSGPRGDGLRPYVVLVCPPDQDTCAADPLPGPTDRQLGRIANPSRPSRLALEEQ